MAHYVWMEEDTEYLFLHLIIKGKTITTIVDSKQHRYEDSSQKVFNLHPPPSGILCDGIL